MAEVEQFNDTGGGGMKGEALVNGNPAVTPPSGEQDESLMDAFNNAINEQYKTPVIEGVTNEGDADHPTELNHANDESLTENGLSETQNANTHSNDEAAENKVENESLVNVQQPDSIPNEETNEEEKRTEESSPTGETDEETSDLILSNEESQLLEKLKYSPFDVTQELESLTSQQRERINMYQRRESLARTGSVKREPSGAGSLPKRTGVDDQASSPTTDPAADNESAVDTGSDLYKCMRLLAPKPYTVTSNANGRAQTLPHSKNSKLSSEGDIFAAASATLDRCNSVKTQADVDRNRSSLNHLRLQFLGLEMPPDNELIDDIESPLTPVETNKLESTPECPKSPKKSSTGGLTNKFYKLMCGSQRSK